MRVSHKLSSALVAVLLLLLSIAQPLAAAPRFQANAGQAYGVTCEAGVCTLRLHDAGLQIPQAVAIGSSFLFQALQENIRLLPDGTGLQITEDVVIETPAGVLNLLDTALTLEIAPDNTLERMRGTARVPWPSLLGTGAANSTLAAATIGVERGRDLAHLKLASALQPDQHYFYMRMGAGLETDDAGAIVQEQLHAITATIPRGQYLTLLMDTTESTLFLDGNVRLSLLEAWMTFDDFLQEQTGLPFELANEAINVHVSGQISADVNRSFLQIDGLYTLEKRFVRSWFQTDASPLAVNGSLRLSREGVLLRGLTHSSIFPDRLFNGEAQLEAFLPLDGSMWDAYIAAGGYATLPALAWQSAGTERLTLNSLQPQVAALLAQTTALAARAQPLFVVVTDTANDAVVYAARGLQVTGSAVGDSYNWAVDQVVNGAQGTVAAVNGGFHSARALAAGSYQWTATLVADGATATADATYNGYVWTVTKLDAGTTTVANVAASGYQRTQAATVAGYRWTVAQSSAGVATIGAWTSDGYQAATNGVAESIEVVQALVWPSQWWGE